MSTQAIERELQRQLYIVATSAYPSAYDLARLEELVRLSRVRRVIEGSVE